MRDYNQNFITLEYSSLNYKNKAHTSYKYFLVCIDNNEVFSFRHNQNTDLYNYGIFKIVYTSIPPGEYSLRIWISL